MNHCVPEFNMDEDYSLPSSSRQKNMQEDEIMELLWQNGQVVLQSQNPRPHRKSPPSNQRHQPPAPPPTSDSSTHLFMQEDEMVSWLQYPLDQDPSLDRDLTDLFYNQASIPSSSAANALRPPPPPPPPPIPHPHHQTPIPTRPENFPHFSRMAARFQDNDPRESTTVVDSSDTPAMRQKSRIRSLVEVSGGGIGGASTAGGGCMSASMSRDGETCELTLTSSPDGSGASASATATADLMNLPPASDRKRKGREPADDATTEYQSEDVEIESHEAKKQARGGAGTKRSRAAEVHNLSERRRRDRINEKMKALQELIPRCSKTDKASMLDEAIEYLKSLQLQVQMMSMGCGMVPVMFPGVQQFMPSMGMGMGLGMAMGMGMDMGMARPMMQFPSVLSGSALPTPGATSHLNPRFPLHAFPLQQPVIPRSDPSRIQQASNQHNIARIPNLAESYQQCVGLQHMPIQIPQPQNQPSSQPSSCKPSTSRGRNEDNEKHPTG